MQTFSHFLHALVTGKALSTTAGPSGGYLVPVEHSTRIFSLAASVSLVRPRAAIIPMQSREVEVPLPDLSTPANAADSPLLSAVTVRWNPEDNETPEAPPALKQARLTDHSLVGYTATAASLAAPATDAVLTSLLAHALAWHADRAFLRGSGVGQPLGILTPAPPPAAKPGRPPAGHLNAKGHPLGLRSRPQGRLTWRTRCRLPG